MKRIKYLLLTGCIAMAVLFTACESDKDFLTEKPKSIFAVENAFKTSDQVVNTLLSAYTEYERFFYSLWFGENVMLGKMGGTDLLDASPQNGPMGNFSTWSPLSGWVKNNWNLYYKMIAYCNLAIAQAENVTWPNPEMKTRVIAESRFLRALSYLRLGIYYGGVPLVTEFSENPRFDYTRETRAATYKYAIDELVAAYADLPEKPVVDNKYEYGRVGKGAAAMFLSEAFLALGVEDNNPTYYAGKTCWKNAADFAQAVIDLHPIMLNRFGARIPGASGSTNGIANAFPEGNVFSDLFVSQNIISTANTEAVWIAVCAPNYATYAVSGGKRGINLGFSPAVQDMDWAAGKQETGTAAGPWKSVSAEYGGSPNPPIHGGMGWGMHPPTWYASVDMWDATNNFNSPNDYRFQEGVTVRTKYLITDATHPRYEEYAGWEDILRGADANTPSKYCTIFYKQTPLDAWDYDLADPGLWGGKAYYYRNQYALRSAEAYLLLAEAKFRDGDNTGALAAINTIRSRANAEDVTTIDMDVILSERGRELLFEEDRWATFLRLKPEEWKPRIYNYGSYTAQANDPKLYPVTRRYSYFTGTIPFNLWPIPQDYIDLNTGAEFPQNTPGWN